MRHQEEQSKGKAYTARVPLDDAERLEAMASAKKLSVNQLLVQAVHAYVQSEYDKPDFQEELKAWIDREHERLERARVAATQVSTTNATSVTTDDEGVPANNASTQGSGD